MSHGAEIPPNLLDSFDAALDDVSIESLALVTDFDGTLSEFVPVLEYAVIHPDTLRPLCRLAARTQLTVVMSGRAARDVEGRVGIDGAVYIGNHGAEWIIDGVVSAAAGAEAAESYLQDILEALAETGDDPGLVLENKMYSASLHYRAATDEEGVVERLRAAVDEMSDTGGFEFYWGNKILEIRRGHSVDKGTSLGRLIDESQPTSVIFLGDDTTDADALRVLRSERRRARSKALASRSSRTAHLTRCWSMRTTA